MLQIAHLCLIICFFLKTPCLYYVVRTFNGYRMVGICSPYAGILVCFVRRTRTLAVVLLETLGNGFESSFPIFVGNIVRMGHIVLSEIFSHFTNQFCEIGVHIPNIILAKTPTSTLSRVFTAFEPPLDARKRTYFVFRLCIKIQCSHILPPNRHCICRHHSQGAANPHALTRYPHLC